MTPRSRKARKIAIFTRKLLRFSTAFLDVLIPRNCVVLGTPLSGKRSELLSNESISRLTFIHEENACTHCGTLISEGDGGLCRECVEQGNDMELQFEHSRSAVIFDEFSRPIIHTLKYNFTPKVACDIARASTHSRGFYKHLENAILVPVPLHKSRLQMRGYNQSLFLAREFAKLAKGAVVEEVLLRTRQTETQTRLEAEMRRKNVSGAFRVARGAKISPFARYILIDDVFTTGSTLSECARALRKEGAVSIDAATFAHVIPPYSRPPAPIDLFHAITGTSN